MIKRYKLIKEYPGSIKLGTIVYERPNRKEWIEATGHEYLYSLTENVNNFLSLSPEIIESSPEFFEEL